MSKLEERIIIENPSITECFSILSAADLPLRTKQHSCKVALGALRLGIVLKESLQLDFSLLNCVCGGLLHDICRPQKLHAKAGADLVKSYGWLTLSNIVNSHTEIPYEVLEKIGLFFENKMLEAMDATQLVDDIDYLYPAICVYLADKYYSGDEYVNLSQRYAFIQKRFENDPVGLTFSKAYEEIAIAVENYFNTNTYETAYVCVDKKNAHPYEEELLLLCEQNKNYPE